MVRKELRWLLGGTVLLSVAALLWAPAPPVNQGSIRSKALEPRPIAAGPRSTEGPEAPAAHRLDPPSEDGRLLPAQIDPFAPTLASPAAPPVAAVALPAPPAPTSPPAAVAAPRVPALPRLAGRMRTPDGQTLIYLRDGDQAVLAAVGAALPSGFVVESISNERMGVPAASSNELAPVNNGDMLLIQLVHPATEHRDVLRVPADHASR